MKQPQIEKYDPRMFRRWYDGPVMIIDSVGLGEVLDTGHASYLVVAHAININEIVKNIPRPFAGTVFVVAPTLIYEQLLNDHVDIDIRLLVV